MYPAVNGRQVMKKIFSPQKNRELLQGWQIHIRKSWKKHAEAAHRLESQYRRMGIMSAILSAVIGASVFASLEAIYEPWSRIVAGLVSLSASVLSSLVTFNRYEERTEKHRTVAARYKAGLRLLEQTLASPRRNSIDSAGLDRLRQELDDLEASAPVVPESISDEIDNNFKEYEFVPKASDLIEKQDKKKSL